MNPDFKKDLNHMIKRYVDGKASAEEIEFVENFDQYLAKNPAKIDQVNEKELMQLEAENYQAILANIEIAERRKTIPFYRYVAAASIFIALGIGIFYISKNKEAPSKAQGIVKATSVDIIPVDVMPGVDRATLTLADGSKIVLDHANKEKLISQTGLTISKTVNGQLIYIAKNTGINPKTVSYHTIQTAKGNQYQLLLPDGTKVWLNAASSLKFPELFNGTERKVELTGEGYFEVAKDRAHPFIVKTINNEASQEVEVLGTHFNINSYMDDHQIKTTLLEGSVRVRNQKSAKLLKPGEQSKLDQDHISIVNVVTDDETAWKDGLFRFNNSGLKSILYQLERWYDVKIDYNNVPNKRFNGMLPRKARLSEVIKMLALTGNIGFKIEKNKQLKVYQK